MSAHTEDEKNKARGRKEGLLLCRSQIIKLHKGNSLACVWLNFASPRQQRDEFSWRNNPNLAPCAELLTVSCFMHGSKTGGIICKCCWLLILIAPKYIHADGLIQIFCAGIRLGKLHGRRWAKAVSFFSSTYASVIKCNPSNSISIDCLDSCSRAETEMILFHPQSSSRNEFSHWRNLSAQYKSQEQYNCTGKIWLWLWKTWNYCL